MIIQFTHVHVSHGYSYLGVKQSSSRSTCDGGGGGGGGGGLALLLWVGGPSSPLLHNTITMYMRAYTIASTSMCRAVHVIK